MRYIKDGPFLDWRGEPVVVKGVPATTCAFLRQVIEAWQPIQGAKETHLTPAQVRTWQKLMDDLEKGPVSGYLALEDDRFVLARSLALAMMPNLALQDKDGTLSFAKYVPQMEDLLASVSAKKPELSPNGVEAKVAT